MGIFRKQKKTWGLKLTTSRTFIFIALFWTAIIIAFGYMSAYSIKDRSLQLMLNQARSFFNLILTTRYWNAFHGTVYVPVTQQTQPNPFLNVPNRDIVSQNGQKFTMVNPAYMTRQIAEFASRRNDVNFHITSIKPIRPENKPYPWEAKALQLFSDKQNIEFYELDMSSKEKNAFKFMAPLWIEDACLKCHAVQGYKLGELRGGISITIPANNMLASTNQTIWKIGSIFFGIWFLGIIGICIAYKKTINDLTGRDKLIRQLEDILNELNSLRGIIPICSSCKKIRTDTGSWEQVEQYIHEHSSAEFSHGICPDCLKKHYPEYKDKMKK